MNKTLRIFRKDVAHLWPQILLFWAVIVIAAAVNPFRDPSAEPGKQLPVFLQPLACWVLVVNLIHNEQLTGHEAWWLTRPFSRVDLGAAKTLFILAFVNLPLLALQCATLYLLGISPIRWFFALLWRQLFFSIMVILPAAAVAVVTRNLGQALLGAILLFGGAWAEAAALYVFGARQTLYQEWIRDSAMSLLVLATCSLAFWLQYTRRLTTVSRAIIGAGLVLTVATPLLPIQSSEIAIQRMLVREPVPGTEALLAFDAARVDTRPYRWSTNSSDPHGERLFVPVRLSDLPANTTITLDWHQVHLSGPRGAWHSGWLGYAGLQFQDTDADGKPRPRGVGWLTVAVDPAYYHSSAATPVNLDATFELTLYRRERVETLPAEPGVLVPEVGVCSPLRLSWCYSPFPQVQVALLTEPPEKDSVFALSYGPYAPFPTSAGFGPMDVTRSPIINNRVGRILVLDRPVAHIQRHVEAHNILLRDFHKIESQ
jgi:hypothetical protein